MAEIMDVSRHQGTIDWAKVKASGKVDGVMIRAMGHSAEGLPSKPYTDPQFARNYAECKRLGIPCGVYGYFKAVDREQADKELAYFKKLLAGRSFELPVAVQALRFDPGELPCCITNLIFSDDRIICVPTNGLNLSGGSTLFLGDDPNYRLEGTTHYPAGMKLVVSYGYFPLETLTDEPLFCAVLQGVQQLQLRKDSEKQHIQQLEQNVAAQQQMVAALQQEIAQLHQKNADLQARSTAYETSLESVFSSKSWKLTAPIRSLMRLFHRGN